MEKTEELCNQILFPKLTEKNIDEIKELAEAGNMQAKLDLIMHNQRVINDKLNKL